MNTKGWKLKEGTTWREKLEKEHPSHGKVVPANASQRRRGIKKLLIPRPRDVDALVRKIPKGHVLTVPQLRERLARKTMQGQRWGGKYGGVAG